MRSQLLLAPPVPAAMCHLCLSEPLPRGAPQRLAAMLRGAIAAHFLDDPDFHGHKGDRTLYRYPSVQYRWLPDGPALFLLGDAAERARAYPFVGLTLQLGEESVTIAEVKWRALALGLAAAPEPRRYRFGAPWLALNKENVLRYEALSPQARRVAELNRILVGNVLSVCKGLGWDIPADLRLQASLESVREVTCGVKGTPMRGFFGTFAINLHLPDGLALGRSVSHGFGWIEAEPQMARPTVRVARHIQRRTPE